MALIKYSDFQKKLAEVGLKIGDITATVVDDKDIILGASIVSISPNHTPVIVGGSYSKALHVGDGKYLRDLIYKLWHLATDQKFYIKLMGFYAFSVEWDWGEGPDTGKFKRCILSEEEKAKIPKFT